MKKLALAVSILTVGVVSAPAADLAPYTKAPPPVAAPIYDWNGFYIGINGGGGSSRKCWELVAFGGVVPLGSEGCHQATGGTAGGQVGYRWETPSNWVFGVEGQGNWANFRGTNASIIFAPDINRSRIDVFGSFTGQVGYAWDNVLLYIKGGAAVTHDRFDAFAAEGLLLATAEETRFGGTVGAGFEYGFAPNWSVGVEYDHLFMGNRNVPFTTLVGFQTDRIRQDVDMGLVRVNYRFASPGIPKY